MENAHHNHRVAIVVLLLFVCSVGCSSPGVDSSAPDVMADAGDGDDITIPRDAATEPDAEEPSSFVVVTFNTGTGPGGRHDRPPDDGYTSAEADITDEWYGNGLNWPPLIEDTRAWFDEVRPDIVTFQEIFWTGECADIPADARDGFVCEGWQSGDPTVAQRVLGPDYQIVCHPGKPDKCAAVHRDFGTFRGCDADSCLEGMTGFEVEGCGSGARVARVVIDRTEGSTLTLVNYHGSSGFGSEEVACRIQQTDQVFVDLGDGDPGVNGEQNLVMGDLNTDPTRLADADDSAGRWNDFVGRRQRFDWHTDVSEDGPATYGAVAIDHVISDAFTGGCWHAGVTEGHDPVSDIVFYDHRPVVCELR